MSCNGKCNSNGKYVYCRDRESRLNPPLPVDENGNWYREDGDVVTGVHPMLRGDPSDSSAAGGDGLTDAERAILADIDPA